MNHAPWFVNPSNEPHIRGPSIWTQLYEMAGFKLRDEICTVNQHGEQTEANARLIAAAPELLAFAEAFIALANNADMRPEDECHELYAKAKAAFSKAIGDKP